LEAPDVRYDVFGLDFAAAGGGLGGGGGVEEGVMLLFVVPPLSLMLLLPVSFILILTLQLLLLLLATMVVCLLPHGNQQATLQPMQDVLEQVKPQSTRQKPDICRHIPARASHKSDIASRERRRRQGLPDAPGANAEDEGEADIQQQEAGLFRAWTAGVLVELVDKSAPVLLRR